MLSLGELTRTNDDDADDDESSICVTTTRCSMATELPTAGNSGGNNVLNWSPIHPPLLTMSYIPLPATIEN